MPKETPLFDPASLRPEASLNRTMIPDLPFIPKALIGKRGYDLLSTAALNRRILAQDVLHINPAGHLVRQLCEVVENPHHPDYPVSRQIVEAFGRDLGFFIAALTNGESDNLVAGRTWRELLENHWRRVEIAYIGGGLVSGAVGPLIARSAVQVLHNVSSKTVAIELAGYPRFLPLIGAARCIPVQNGCSLVYDFGQSALKSGLARYEDGQLVRLQLLPPISMVEVTQSNVSTLAAFMVDTIAQSFRSSPLPVAGEMAVSLASYLESGQPCAYQGGLFAELRTLSISFQDWLGEKLSAELGRNIAVKLLHDGTAAAFRYAEEPNAAVIMLGTALGVGFTSQQVTVPVSEHFCLEAANNLA